MHRIDLYNKSRVMGDYQARFCEKLGVKLPLLTRRSVRYRYLLILNTSVY